MDKAKTPPPADAPGKVRTWWHPLFVGMLRFALQGIARVQEEVSLGQLPLRLDALLHREPDPVDPTHAQRHLGAVLQRLRRYTFIHFTSPADGLEASDLNQAMAYVFLGNSQELANPPLDDISLLFIAPQLTKPFAEQVVRHRANLVAEEVGIYALPGLAVSSWLLETNRLAGVRHPILALFSVEFHRRPRELATALGRAGFQRLARFMLQQIRGLFHTAEGKPMNPGDLQEMEALDDAIMEELFAELTPEKWVRYLTPERLAGLTPEQRLEGLPPEQLAAQLTPEQRLAGLPPEQLAAQLTPEQRLAGLPPEQRLAGLTPEQRARLRELLQEGESSR